ncbi:LLM class flavin-dependent oxidoreductase [Herbiconiux moechotypicola]|uniref:NtaA/DmoA family FMN-dependent monooxygenase n=1 Tax=Herbiconiux moechotypicola TaxID=637393 RepID=A0ABN3D8Z0_9MICO|nr:LLM class flavin-dependent oxidoreductase [Herbiconiux moechotypicola]MCS5728180.1 LLM class flavin-dependent oxidoreductase [Herbiconiux moechotypicola]
MSQPLRRVHLGAFYPNDHHFTLWSHPDAGSQIEFDAFLRFARGAERGLFDFVFLAEANWLQEHRGRVVDHAILDKPDPLTVLSGLAAETTHIGLVATVGTTFSDPYDVARRLAALQHLSQGRAGWNVVTSHTTFGIGASTNFRPGRMVAHADRYRQADAFLREVGALWAGDDPSAAFDAVAGHRPAIVQAGGSPEGRDLAAAHADVVFAGRRSIPESKAFCDDVRARRRAAGRHDQVLFLPSTAFVLGDTPAEAEERLREWRALEMTPRTAIFLLEEVWGHDLSGLDVDGPLPAFDPDWAHAEAFTRGEVGEARDARVMIAEWRALAEERSLSVRELLGVVRARRDFVGTPRQVAEEINAWVQAGAADGFVVNPSVVPSGIEEFVDRVVPELQELGVYREEYSGSTLHDHLHEGDARVR